eukprot:5625329-Pyramimonas_sp.AAC.2
MRKRARGRAGQGGAPLSPDSRSRHVLWIPRSRPSRSTPVISAAVGPVTPRSFLRIILTSTAHDEPHVVICLFLCTSGRTLCLILLLLLYVVSQG